MKDNIEKKCLWCEKPTTFYQEDYRKVQFTCPECGDYIIPKTDINNEKKAKENLYNRKIDIIFNMLIEIMRNQKNPLWKGFAKEYTAINKKLKKEYNIKKEDVTEYVEEIPEWIV